MEPIGERSALGVVSGLLATLAALAVFGLTVIYTGAVNVAATEEHQSFTRWAFDTTFQKSVELRASDIAAPEAIAPEMLAAGASAYNAMCQHCHAGPGAEREDWASGMRPRPPHLTEAAANWELEQLYWIVKYGVTMTWMAVFGPSHDDRALWGIAALVRELPP